MDMLRINLRKKTLGNVRFSKQSPIPIIYVSLTLLYALKFIMSGPTLRVGKVHRRWEVVRYENSVLQCNFAQDLTRRTDITISSEGYGIREIECFQRFLATSNVAITILIISDW